MLRKSWGCNIYIIDDGCLALVDSGFPLDARALARRLERSYGRGPDVMIATHCHLDHMGSMARLTASFGGGEVVAHRDDAPVMEGTLPYPTFKLDAVRAVYYKLLGPLYRYECVEVDRAVVDGETIDVFGGLEVIHVPGHTEGSIALYQPERKMLFTGDTIRNENDVLDGPPPRFTPDMERAWGGIAERLATLDFEVLLPGHGRPLLSGGRDAVRRMLERRNDGRGSG